MKKHLYAFAIGVAVGLQRFSEKKLRIKRPHYNACVCVDFVRMQANPDCHECWGTGVRPDESYGKKGILLTYHKYKSPLRHLKPLMAADDQRVYRHAVELRNRFLERVVLPGPSYRHDLPAWQEPFEDKLPESNPLS